MRKPPRGRDVKVPRSVAEEDEYTRLPFLSGLNFPSRSFDVLLRSNKLGTNAYRSAEKASSTAPSGGLPLNEHPDNDNYVYIALRPLAKI